MGRKGGLLNKRKENSKNALAVIWSVPPCDERSHVFAVKTNERPAIGKVCECGKTRFVGYAEPITQ